MIRDVDAKRETQKQAGQELGNPQDGATHDKPLPSKQNSRAAGSVEGEETGKVGSARRMRAISEGIEPSLPEDDAKRRTLHRSGQVPLGQWLVTASAVGPLEQGSGFLHSLAAALKV